MTVTDPGTPLEGAKLDAFLELDLTARLSCVDDRDWPYCVPVWHQWDGERFWIIGSRHARWVQFLLSKPRVALAIDEPETVRRVLCQGTARHVEGPSTDGRWVDIAHQMVARYLGADAIPGYDRSTAGMERWLFAIGVDTMVTWQGPGTTNG